MERQFAIVRSRVRPAVVRRPTQPRGVPRLPRHARSYRDSHLELDDGRSALAGALLRRAAAACEVKLQNLLARDAKVSDSALDFGCPWQRRMRETAARRHQAAFFMSVGHGSGASVEGTGRAVSRGRHGWAIWPKHPRSSAVALGTVKWFNEAKGF